MVRLKKLRYGLLGLGVLLLCIISPPVWAHLTTSPAIHSPSTEAIAVTPKTLDQRALSAYQLGQYQQAANLLQQAQQQYIQQEAPVKAAIALSNLSLTYQRLGAWEKANKALQQAQQQLHNQQVALPVQAQILDVKGQLNFALGQLDLALGAWQQSEQLYNQTGDVQRQMLSRLNQAQAFQAQGRFQKVSSTLMALSTAVSNQPNTLTKAKIFRQLGDNFRATGNLNEAQKQLKESLDIATQLADPTLIAASNLSLGNLEQSRFKTEVESQQLSKANSSMKKALNYYQQVTKFDQGELDVQATLNLMRLLIHPSLPQWNLALRLYPTIQDSLADLPPGRETIFAYVGLAENLMTLRENKVVNTPDGQEIAMLLVEAQRQAETLGDRRSQSMVLGALGHLYEQSQQWDETLEFSRQALKAAQDAQASDLSYQWEWQRGRVLKHQGKETEAIAAYTRAFEILKTIRSDLITANPDVRFSFRESVEPIYRELVGLLLDSVPEGQLTSQLKANQKPSFDRDQARLRQARDVMDALQVAELDNFFQAACIDRTVRLDEVVNEGDKTAAVFHTILLDDRLEVVMKLPNQENEADNLVHYSSTTQGKVDDINDFLKNYRARLVNGRNVVQEGKQLYDLLLRPAIEQGLFAPDKIKTLIFVLDGELRLIPMTTLHDDDEFLVRKYAISIVLGQEIRDPQILPSRDELKILAASLETPPRQEDLPFYDILPGVTEEIKSIEQTEMLTTTLQDEAFTGEALATMLSEQDFNIVHLATHGQFGSDRQDTYIVEAGGRLGIEQMGQIFRNSRQADARLEMLILSACKTATGNSREVLGIAGAMVQSGARSAIATLWSVDDNASVEFMKALYEQLAKPGISRAEAIRRAQVVLLDRYPGRPRYWAPYILVGSWR